MKFSELILYLLLIVLFGGLAYFAFQMFSGEDVDLGEYSNNISLDVPAASYQFYSNLRFRDRTISYSFGDQCNSEKINNVNRAFQILEDKTVLRFVELTRNGEIRIYCAELAPEPEEKGHFIAGEGGPVEIVNNTYYSVIYYGKISLYKEEKCDQPLIALHEILHVLGFDHNSNKRSVLYPYTDCKQQFDDYLINEINRLYSEDSLPDLALTTVSAKKSGKYIDFNLTVANYGLKDAGQAKLVIKTDDNLFKEYELGSLEIGTKKSLSVSNLLVLKSFDKLSFLVVLNEKEIKKENNKVDLSSL